MSGLKRTKSVKIRLTEDEFANLGENVTKSGFPNREAYLRKMALGGQII